MKLTQPSWPKVFPTSVVLALARLGPIGNKLPAPGTWGSLVGIAYFVLFFESCNLWEVLFYTAIMSYVAVAFCGEAEVRLGKSDPGEVILDEFVAMPLVFLGYPLLRSSFSEWILMILGFILFRIFDILKPFGIKKLQRLNAGWGVVVDDLVAALAACLTLHLLRIVIPH
jgi:phosphatidylglycerophosphatase A